MTVSVLRKEDRWLMLSCYVIVSVLKEGEEMKRRMERKTSINTGYERYATCKLLDHEPCHVTASSSYFLCMSFVT